MSIGSVLATAIHDVENALNSVLHLDEEQVHQLVGTLNEAADGLKDKDFGEARISSASFGGNDAAASLGFHHDKAYEVVNDTLVGVMEDLLAFATNVQQVAKLIKETDDNVAVDLKTKQEVVDGLLYTSGHSHADSANHDARNHHLGGGR
jgi:hypothetical protein